jgi:hypothetical protein
MKKEMLDEMREDRRRVKARWENKRNKGLFDIARPREIQLQQPTGMNKVQQLLFTLKQKFYGVQAAPQDIRKPQVINSATTFHQQRAQQFAKMQQQFTIMKAET